MIEHDLTADQVSKKIGHCKESVMRWLRQQTCPGEKQIRKIFDRLGLDPEQFFAGSALDSYVETSVLSFAVLQDRFKQAQVSGDSILAFSIAAHAAVRIHTIFSSKGLDTTLTLDPAISQVKLVINLDIPMRTYMVLDVVSDDNQLKLRLTYHTLINEKPSPSVDQLRMLNQTVVEGLADRFFKCLQETCKNNELQNV